MDRTEALKKSPLFSDFTEKELASVASTAKERSFSAGDSIIERGREGGRGFYLLLEGKANVSAGGKDLAEFGPGDYFGEMALLLEDTPRTADVTAVEDTTCLVITSWDLKALLKSHPEIGVKMMSELARRLRETDQALTE